jgi:cytochrome o ubiquinol oxidase subunit 3
VATHATTTAPAFEIPEHHRTNTGQPHRKVLMWTFLASDCMFFGSLFATHFIYRNNVKAGPTPVELFDSIWFVSFLAFLLIISSFTMVLGLSAAKKGDQKMMSFWLMVTALFGLTFIAGQGYEFYQFVNHDQMTPRTSLFAASFLGLTGFHGAHVTVGILWLMGVVFLNKLDPLKPRQPGILDRMAGMVSGTPHRTEEARVEVKPRYRRYSAFARTGGQAGPVTAQDAAALALEEYEIQRVRQEKVLNVELAGLYWHFVDIVFVVIFAGIYLLR